MVPQLSIVATFGQFFRNLIQFFARFRFYVSLPIFLHNALKKHSYRIDLSKPNWCCPTKKIIYQIQKLILSVTLLKYLSKCQYYSILMRYEHLIFFPYFRAKLHFYINFHSQQSQRETAFNRNFFCMLLLASHRSNLKRQWRYIRKIQVSQSHYFFQGLIIAK